MLEVRAYVVGVCGYEELDLRKNKLSLLGYSAYMISFSVCSCG